MKRVYKNLRIGVMTAVIISSAAGCSRSSVKVRRSWVELIDRLADIEAVCRLDEQPTHLISSYDRSGKNEDYNNFEKEGPVGWDELADIRGPGYISRFWFTGADDGHHKLRIYIDGARQPVFDGTIGEFCGGQAPFIAPLAVTESFGWYTYVPIPFRKRIIIRVQEGNTREGNWPRIFYQINYSRLPEGETVESFSLPVPDAVQEALKWVGEVWQRDDFDVTGDCSIKTIQTHVEAGQTTEALALPGPGMIRELGLTPDLSGISSARERRAMLHNLVLRIEWDDSGSDSVASPLGEFYGSFHGPVQYESMFLGMKDGTYFTRFPMPFRQSARIRLENRGAHTVPVSVRAACDESYVPKVSDGYFHAGWHSTSPNDIGRPHPILRAKGHGRFAGTMLSVVSLDQQQGWWILEGDETIRLDDETIPGWKGTGLEDYFNGAWYYQNPIACPLSGLLFKAPYRTVQYRMHQPDPVQFASGVEMLFERGPDHASSGWLESVAYYYMARPQTAFSMLNSALSRIPPEDPLAKMTLMIEVLNAERLGDHAGAEEIIDAYLEAQEDFPFAPVLQARKLAYREKREGFAAVKPAYEAFLATETNEMARKQVEDILWYNEDPQRALLGLYCNTPVRVFLDGRLLAESRHPDKMSIERLTIDPGEHQLAIQAKWGPYPKWVQICLRTHKGDFITSRDWKHAYDPPGGWSAVKYDDSTWIPLGGTGLKGPPETPYIWVEPNIYIDMQSVAEGLRPREEAWPDKNGFVVYRKKITVQ
ncbi:MAG: DUF2961 domain-containing protein [Spartobacteria bacterium]|nr:DUF2961 domain-containing protein [Spartobacteria bacterium]